MLLDLLGGSPAHSTTREGSVGQPPLTSSTANNMDLLDLLGGIGDPSPVLTSREIPNNHAPLGGIVFDSMEENCSRSEEFLANSGGAGLMINNSSNVFNTNSDHGVVPTKGVGLLMDNSFLDEFQHEVHECEKCVFKWDSSIF